MKRIACPFPARNKQICVLIVLGTIFGAAAAMASLRPRYTGTLRVQVRERVATIDPRRWPSDSLEVAATVRLASLVFDRLVRFDERGSPQPRLAISWE